MKRPQKTRLQPGKPRNKTRPQPGPAELKRLLKWAIDYIQKDVEELTDSFSTSAGSIDDPGIEREVRDCKEWIRKAREAMK